MGDEARGDGAGDARKAHAQGRHAGPKALVEELVTYNFPYVMMNDVMRVVKEMKPRIVNQVYDNTCEITLSIRKSEAEQLKNRLDKLSFE